MKILIVGLGSIALKHIHAIREIVPDSEIISIRSSRESKYVDGVTDFYSYEELPSDFDFALISNPTSKHIETIKKLVPFRKPLLIEKPLSDSVEIETSVLNLDSTGVLTYVGCNLRFLESIRFVKDWLTQRKPYVNEVNVYCGSYLPDWRPGVDYRKCYSAIPELGGGVHIDLIHEIDYVYWLFGKPKIVEKRFTNSSVLGIRSIDYANYTLGYDTFTAQIILNYYRKDSKRQMEIITDFGTLTVDLLNNRVSLDNAIIFQSNQRIADTYKAQMEYFISNVKANRVMMNTIKDAYNVLQISF